MLVVHFKTALNSFMWKYFKDLPWGGYAFLVCIQKLQEIPSHMAE